MANQREIVTILPCKKCKGEAILRKNSSCLLVQIKCSCVSCGNEGAFECFSQDAISDWNRKNK
jgi:hypothetical protein